MEFLSKKQLVHCQNSIFTYNDLLKEKNKHYDNSKEKIVHFLNIKLFLEQYKSKKISAKRDKILTLINTALKDIFNKNYYLKIISNDEEDGSDSIEIKYHLVLFKNDFEIARDEKLLSSNGGGILSVISVLFKILIGILHNNEKLFFFDESLAQVSKHYRPQLSNFIRKLCEQENITLVLVSHVDDMDDFAHLTYHLNAKRVKGYDSLYIDKTIENFNDFIPKNSYHLNLDYFQSIEHISITFKGYTILKGSNDIGKSAIIRSITSILYNTFQENYVRHNIPKGENTTIEFSKKENDQVVYEMSLKKTSSSVLYSVNGKEFKGKKSAGAELKEVFDDIGFKTFKNANFLNKKSVKEKEQLEQLSITTQHDPLYIVSNNTNDNNNLFGYLFNAQTIIDALNRLKEDIKKENLFLKELEKEIQVLDRKKELYQKYVEFFTLKYEKEVLEYLIVANKSINLKKKQEKDLTQIIKSYKEIGLILLLKNKKALHFNHLFLLNKIENLFSYYKEIRLNYSFLHKTNYLTIKKKEFESINQQLNHYKNIIPYFYEMNNLLKLKEKTKLINEKKSYFMEVKSKVSIYKELQIVLKEKLFLFLNLRNIQRNKNLDSVKYLLKLINENILLIRLKEKKYNYNLTQISYQKNEQQFLDFQNKYEMKVCDCCHGKGMYIKK